MRQPRPVRPFRATDLLLPATALAAVVASALLVLAAVPARVERPASPSGATLSALDSPVGRPR